MKTKLLLLIFTLGAIVSNAQDIKEIIRQADEKFRGESSQGTMTMIIERPTWSREVTMKNLTFFFCWCCNIY